MTTDDTMERIEHDVIFEDTFETGLENEKIYPRQ